MMILVLLALIHSLGVDAAAERSGSNHVTEITNKNYFRFPNFQNIIFKISCPH